MFERQRIKLKFFQFVRDPTRTSLIFEMYELASRVPGASQAVAAVEARALADPSFRELYEHRASFEVPSLEVLSALAADTLGFAYSAHLRKYHLATNFYRAPHGNRVIDYISYRLYQTHDLWHVVLGYDISPAGELGVQAFTLAQLGTPFSFLLMAGGMLSIVESAPELCEETFGTMTEGYGKGNVSNFLPSFPFEEHWESPLSVVRELAGLTRHSSGPSKAALFSPAEFIRYVSGRSCGNGDATKGDIGMKATKGLVLSLCALCALLVSSVEAAEAYVTDILQYGTVVAVYLSPDPGPQTCQYGSPYLLTVDDSAENKQKFAMILTALAGGKKVAVYADGCSTAIWAQSRPTIWRLLLRGE